MARNTVDPSSSCDTLADVETLPDAVDKEKLGRQRPDAFSSAWTEIAFVVSILVSLAMADFLIGGFQVVLPALIKPLDIPPASQTWPSSVLTLVAGAFLFPMGRVADMFGGYLVFVTGLGYFTLWVVAAGFSDNFVVLVVCRAMQGLGASAFLPAGISLLGRIYRPGPRKNFVFSLYGAIAPLGFFSGILIGGLSYDFLSWRWYFWLGGIITAISCIGTSLTAPRDYVEARAMNVKMDWWGTATVVPGLLLVIYAITGSSAASQGWASPEIIVVLVLGILFLGAAVYVETRVASAPLIPAEIFKVKYMKRMLLCLFITWGVFSTYLFYSNFYIELIIGESPLKTAVWFAPWIAGGILLATTSGLILHVLPGRLLLIISGICKILAVLLFAVMPENPNYWAWVFPAMLAEAACVDVLWTVSNVFLTTSLPRHQQGLAGALINVTLFIGGAFFLAIADVAMTNFKKTGMDLRQQYKGVFWIAVGAAGLALIICFFMRLGKAGCAPTVDVNSEAGVEDDHSSEAKDPSIVIADDMSETTVVAASTTGEIEGICRRGSEVDSLADEKTLHEESRQHDDVPLADGNAHVEDLCLEDKMTREGRLEENWI